MCAGHVAQVGCSADYTTNQQKSEPQRRVGRAGFSALVLAREHGWRSVSMSGFARRRGSNIGRSGEHRAFGAPMNRNCTLWTLRVACFKSAFFASFLCRFGQRNDVPPRTVANSDKEKIRLSQTTTAESTNPHPNPRQNPNPRPARATPFRLLSSRSESLSRQSECACRPTARAIALPSS